MSEFSQLALVPEQGIEPKKEQLDREMQQRIEETAARLNIRDSGSVLAFGAKAQKEMGRFSDLALAQMLKSDIKPLDSVMKTLTDAIRSCSFSSVSKGFLKKLFGNGTSLADLRLTYEAAEPQINRCADELTDRRVALLRDSALLDRLYGRNEELYRELCSLLVIGDEALRQARTSGVPEHALTQMERRMQDLRTTRMASTQLAAQIRMIQSNDQLTCERLQSTLEVTIPLWKAQMATALGLARANESLQRQKQASGMAARGVRDTAADMRRQTGKLAKNVQESDQERAEEIAETLLNELDEIEKSLKEQEQLRQGM